MNKIHLIPFTTIQINPLTREGTLFIKNTSSLPIIFKIKTTHPESYTVRPNIGIVEPKMHTSIRIVLADASSSLRSHRFMVQVHSFSEYPADIRRFVKDPANKPFIHRKYNVEFEMADAARQKEEGGVAEKLVLLAVAWQFLVLVRKILW